MKLSYSCESSLKHLGLLCLFSISNTGFAERNPNILEACTQFKTSSVKTVDDEVTFKYYAGLPQSIYRTYYKGVDSNYYSSAEDRKNNTLRMTPRGDIFVRPLAHISAQEYKNFFSTCKIFVDDGLIQFGFYLLESSYDPVSAAKALEDSEWFEVSYPMFMTYFSEDRLKE